MRTSVKIDNYLSNWLDEHKGPEGRKPIKRRGYASFERNGSFPLLWVLMCAIRESRKAARDSGVRSIEANSWILMYSVDAA